MLFLKYLDDVEAEREAAAMLDGRPYSPILDAGHRWAAWAAPRKSDGSFDHDTALTGDDLIAYVTGTLWRSEEHTSELQSLMRISYAVFCLKKQKNNINERSE